MVPGATPGPHRRGALLVAGAASGVGKSTITAALCRWLARSGTSVAPFKAQNMSNHAAVTADGGEVGRAQAMQASAAGVDVTTAMNPILLKPSADVARPDGHRGPGSHVVVLGREVPATDALDWGARTTDLRSVVADSLTALRRTYDLVVAEGAGGAGELNLWRRDLVNLPLAAATGMPAVLVVDIDRGGAFAAAHGTIDLLPASLRDTVGGIVFNNFRGDVGLLDDGVRYLARRTGVPFLGVLPRLDGPLLGTEDSLDLDHAFRALDGEPSTERPIRVAVVRFPHLANPSDLDPLAIEPGVDVAWATRPDQLAHADLIVLAGSRATVADLGWLRRTGLADAICSAERSLVVGICAGQQMLGRDIDDPVESGVGRVDGLGLLDATTRFESHKVVARRSGTVTHGPLQGTAVSGYQIHSGRCVSETPWLDLDGTADGSRSADGRVWGTSLHGVFDDDVFRHRLLTTVAERTARTAPSGTWSFGGAVAAQHDRLADWLDAHVDIAALLELAATATDCGAPARWPDDADLMPV